MKCKFIDLIKSERKDYMITSQCSMVFKKTDFNCWEIIGWLKTKSSAAILF